MSLTCCDSTSGEDHRASPEREWDGEASEQVTAKAKARFEALGQARTCLDLLVLASYALQGNMMAAVSHWVVGRMNAGC